MKRNLLASAGVLAMASLFGAAAQAQNVGAQSGQEMSDRSPYDRQYDTRNNGSRDREAWREAYDSIYGDGRDRAGRDGGRHSDDQQAQYREPYQWNRADANGFSGTGIDYGGSPYSELRYSELRQSDRGGQDSRDYRRDRDGAQNRWSNDRAYGDDYGRDQYARQNGGGRYDRNYDDSGWRDNRGYPHTESFTDPGRLGPDRTMAEQAWDRRQPTQSRDGSGWESGEGYPHTESFSDRGYGGQNSGAYRDQYGQFVPLSPKRPETMSPRDNSRDYPSNYEMGTPYRDRGWQSRRAQGQYDYRPGQHPENQTWSDSGEMSHEAWEQGRFGYYGDGGGSYPAYRTPADRGYPQSEQRTSGQPYDRGAGMTARAGNDRMAGNRWETEDRGMVLIRQPMAGYPADAYILVGRMTGTSGERPQEMSEGEKAAFGVDSNEDGFVSDDEVGKLAEARFDRLDRDGNGELDESELQAVGLGASDEGVSGNGSQTTAKLDADGDGKISREDFVGSASDAYGEADSDEDGRISIWEFRSHQMPG